ncbi:hypothetical protein FHX82_003816 [Amycolatopsis bartoniae]|nr:molybdopterin-binding protein [Amycolatopsis bartoniae]MBB2936752.1 hypothetical protein [Amycolatopsis bartoniae]TVT09197.1 molybdopterin-binding protein [Amycolatopsis bartoniae]
MEPAAPPIPAPRTPLGPAQVLITGAVAAERVLETAELAARARERYEVPYVTRRRREVHHVYAVPLYDVLAEAGFDVDARHKRGLLNVVVVANSEDGYQVALSLAEIDPEFGARPALLATHYNGAVLTRPTLVLPQDNRSSRYVRGLCRLCLVNIAPWGLLGSPPTGSHHSFPGTL